MPNDFIIVMDKFGGAHLEHKSYKYTKRERIGDKWRYWYDTNISGKSYKKEMTEAQRDLDYRKNRQAEFKSKGYYNISSKNKDALNMWYNASLGGRPNSYKYEQAPYSNHQPLQYVKAMTRYMRGIKDYDNEKIAEDSRIVYNAKKKYDKTLYGNIDKLVSKGKGIIDSLLNKIKNKNKNENGNKNTNKYKTNTIQKPKVETIKDVSTGKEYINVNNQGWVQTGGKTRSRKKNVTGTGTGLYRREKVPSGNR